MSGILSGKIVQVGGGPGTLPQDPEVPIYDRKIYRDHKEHQTDLEERLEISFPRLKNGQAPKLEHRRNKYLRAFYQPNKPRSPVPHSPFLPGY